MDGGARQIRRARGGRLALASGITFWDFPPRKLPDTAVLAAGCFPAKMPLLE